jgi:hypothetical protein
MTRRGRLWLLVVTVLAAGAVLYGTVRGVRFWRTWRAAKAADDVDRLQNDYHKCMIGDAAGTDAIDTVQHIEMNLPEHPSTEAASWPDRCRTYAAAMHARLVESDLVDRGNDPATFDVWARRAMEPEPPLPPGAPLDTTRYTLMYGAPGPVDANVPPPPPAAAPVPLDVGDALVHNSARPISDPMPSAKVRLAWLRGGGLRQYCVLSPAAGAPFFTASCPGDLPGDSLSLSGGVVGMSDGTAGIVMSTDSSLAPGIVASDPPPDEHFLWLAPGDSSYVFADGLLATVQPTPGGKRELVRARESCPGRRHHDGCQPKAIDRAAVAATATLVDHVLAWTDQGASKSTHLFARDVPEQGPLAPVQDLGAIAEGAGDWRACRSDTRLFVVGAREVGRSNEVVTARITVAIDDGNGAFAAPVEGETAWPARSPRWWEAASLSCAGDAVALTSIVEGAVHQVACTRAGCIAHTSSAFLVEHDLSRIAAVDLAGRVLLARVVDLPGPVHALVTTVRMRLAAAEALAGAPDVVVLGVAGAWGWDEHFRPFAVDAFARRNVALLLARASEAAILIGVDSTGAFGLVRAASR